MLIFFIGLSTLFFTKTLHAEEMVKSSVFDVMSYTEILNLTIETEVDSLSENRRSAAEYPSILSFEDEHGQTWPHMTQQL